MSDNRFQESCMFGKKRNTSTVEESFRHKYFGPNIEPPFFTKPSARNNGRSDLRLFFMRGGVIL